MTPVVYLKQVSSTPGDTRQMTKSESSCFTLSLRVSFHEKNKNKIKKTLEGRGGEGGVTLSTPQHVSIHPLAVDPFVID